MQSPRMLDHYPGVTILYPEERALPDLLTTYEESNTQLSGHKDRYRNIAEDKVHFERSHSYILRGATGLKGAALIVGIGNATDIPFNELAKQFDKVTIVEIDPKSIGRALGLLDKELLKKITVVIADLTGCMASLSKEVESLKSSARTTEDFLKGFYKALPTIKPKTLASLGEKQFDYVVSHLVLTQLGTIPISWVTEASKHLPTAVLASDPLLTFTKSLQCQHLHDLHRWAKDSATLFVADTSTNHACIRPAPQALPVLSQLAASSLDGTLSEVFNKLFRLKESIRPWIYYNQPPAHEKGARGTAYIVQAYLLAPLKLAD